MFSHTPTVTLIKDSNYVLSVVMFIFFASPRIRVSQFEAEKWRFVGMLYCTPFIPVYNILLCLHIFSVHIIHQSKNRNYENLDQLSYDNKRGPKVYLHGQCTPPTNLNVATRIWPVSHRPTQKCPYLGSTCFFLHRDFLFLVPLWFKWRMDLFWTIMIFSFPERQKKERKVNTLRFCHYHFFPFQIKECMIQIK